MSDLSLDNLLIFEKSVSGRVGYSLPTENIDIDLDDKYLRKASLDMPELSELDVVRHYTNLSLKNFGVDQGFYPLGSCTMKYNPKINEKIASDYRFQNIHPLQNDESKQGSLEIAYEVCKDLSKITGMDDFTLSPCAGAHGELTGLMIIKNYFLVKGDLKRTKIIVPESAHGTNPASSSMCGFEVVKVNCLEDGCVDIDELEKLATDEIAGIMLTNPNTLGIFEKDILRISNIIHNVGGLLYYDGANLNGILGLARPGDMGFDVCHINIHKTFSTPHGGGGPGSGAVGVKHFLQSYLPVPFIVKENGKYILTKPKHTIGRVSTFMGNFSVIIKAYGYLKSLGNENIAMIGRLATLNANYIKESLKDYYLLPINKHCKHEVVFDGLIDKKATTLDVAKRLLDYGFHPFTIYFPLLFHESLMIEPTETESKETIDKFIDAMIKIAKEDADIIKSSPHNTIINRLDDVKAVRMPILKYKDLHKYE